MNKLILVCAFLIPTAAFAEKTRAKFGFDIEPIVGYERVQKLIPTAHTSDRLVYGARVTAGFPLLAAEAEYLRGTDTESFPSQNLEVTEVSDKAKLGVRSSLALGKLVRLTARGGAQAKQNERTEVLNGVTTVTKDPLVYNPYAGAGLKVGLGKRFALSGDMVVVFGDFPNMDKNEYQVTLGFSVKLP